MKDQCLTKRYSLGEEIASAITHGIGAELAIAALVFLILRAARCAPGWTLFGIILALAIAGITCYAIFGARMRKLSAITYIPMGLIIIFASGPMKESLFAASGSDASWQLLLAGGACYIAGTAFYAMKKIKWTHSVWHLFVIAGSFLHFLSVFHSI